MQGAHIPTHLSTPSLCLYRRCPCRFLWLEVSGAEASLRTRLIRCVEEVLAAGLVRPFPGPAHSVSRCCLWGESAIRGFVGGTALTALVLDFMGAVALQVTRESLLELQEVELLEEAGLVESRAAWEAKEAALSHALFYSGASYVSLPHSASRLY